MNDPQANIYRKLNTILLNPFHVTALFYTPSEQKTSGFLMFAGGTERDQRHEMG